MKIALIADFCPHYRYKLYSMLSKEHDFDFYFYRKDQKEKVKRVKTIREGPNFWYLSYFQIFKRLIKGRYDVVITITLNKWAFFSSFLISKITGAKFIVWHTIWYYPPTFKYKAFSKILLMILKNYADAIIVYGLHGKVFLKSKGVLDEKIFIAWQAVDNELYNKKIAYEEVEDIRTKLNIETNQVVLFVGRFRELKGMKYLMQALDGTSNKNAFTVLFVGGGPLRNYMEDFCNKHGIKVRFAGLLSYDKLPIYYKLATLLVLPSITVYRKESWGFKEPWGLVVNEAFNQGCPAVTSDSVGAAAGGLVKDNVNGFIVPERDSRALIVAIESILNSTKMRDELSKNASCEIKKWTYERQAEGVIGAIEYVCQV